MIWVFSTHGHYKGTFLIVLLKVSALLQLLVQGHGLLSIPLSSVYSINGPSRVSTPLPHLWSSNSPLLNNHAPPLLYITGSFFPPHFYHKDGGSRFLWNVVNHPQAIQCHNPEDPNQNLCWEKLKSQYSFYLTLISMRIFMCYVIFPVIITFFFCWGIHIYNYKNTKYNIFFPCDIHHVLLFTKFFCVISKVNMAETTRATVLWDVMLGSQVWVYWCFGGIQCLHLQVKE